MLKSETFTRPRYENQRNAFSHSRQCDDLFSIVSVLTGGVEHVACLCWCHGSGESEPLFETDSGPEYDLTPPPEYATTADIYEPGETDAQAYVSNCTQIDVDPDILDMQPDTVSPVKYLGRSPQEIARNKCDTCGDSLSKCECVE